MNDLKVKAKEMVGERVAGWITSGMTLGLGTGSTASCAIRALGRRIREEGLDVSGIATSFASERLSRTEGIRLTSFDELEFVDLAFDGADEVDPALNLIKGRGAAQTREKIVAHRARRFVVLIDASKHVDQLGSRMPVPVEVVPMAAMPVIRLLTRMGAEATIRMGQQKDGPVVSDQGLWIIDAAFEGIDDPYALNRVLQETPGVLDHGLFLDLATDVLTGLEDGSVEHSRK